MASKPRTKKVAANKPAAGTAPVQAVPVLAKPAAVIPALPLPVSRVILLCATALSADDFNATAAGCALLRMGHDRRLQPRLLVGAPAAPQDPSRMHLHKLLATLKQDTTSGLVWMRDDVVVEDFLLCERLSEAWAQQEMVVIRDAGGAIVFWAVARRALLRWTQRHEPAGDGAATPSPAPFPQAEVDELLGLGMRGDVWPIALSLGPRTPATVAASCAQARPMPALLQTSDAPQPADLLLVCATRESPERFMTHTATGRSVARLRAAGVNVRLNVLGNNGAALAKHYNAAIDPPLGQCIVAFAHDDIWIDDYFFAHHLHDGLLRYDVVGLAGNRNRVPYQPGWPYPKEIGRWDARDNLLGHVAHPARGSAASDKKQQRFDPVSSYGRARGPARVLDGLVIATRMSTLLISGARFDERFPFHFYDLDFCRVAEERGLRLGVWPVAVTHMSGGSGYGSVDWQACWGRYIGKWGH